MSFSACVLACMSVQARGCTFGCISVCLSTLSRCAGTTACCNVSCFANCLRSVVSCDAEQGIEDRKRVLIVCLGYYILCLT